MASIRLFCMNVKQDTNVIQGLFAILTFNLDYTELESIKSIVFYIENKSY